LEDAPGDAPTDSTDNKFDFTGDDLDDFTGGPDAAATPEDDTAAAGSVGMSPGTSATKLAPYQVELNKPPPLPLQTNQRSREHIAIFQKEFERRRRVFEEETKATKATKDAANAAAKEAAKVAKDAGKAAVTATKEATKAAKQAAKTAKVANSRRRWPSLSVVVRRRPSSN